MRYNIYMKSDKSDVLIIGAGPAGLTAGIFTCRAGLGTTCVEKLAVGGQASLTYNVANYPGFESISGFDLTEKMANQAKSNGLKLEWGTVKSLTKTKSGFSLKTQDRTYTSKKVIIATGCKTRKLGLKDEERLTGRGISYCASCDGGFFQDKVVAVVGGGNTAITDVEYLSRLAKKIYLINRSDKFRAGDYAVDKIKKFKNLEILTNAQVVELFGDEKLDAILVKDNLGTKKLAVDGLFIAIGSTPDLDFVKFDLKTDKAGYIVVDDNMRTNVENLFACGDITNRDFRQIVVACAQGAIAGNSAIGEK